MKVQTHHIISREFYEAGAVLLEEDAHILQGLMVGLNCIDCHLSIRDNLHLDDPVRTFPLSLYYSVTFSTQLTVNTDKFCS